MITLKSNGSIDAIKDSRNMNGFLLTLLMIFIMFCVISLIIFSAAMIYGVDFEASEGTPNPINSSFLSSETGTLLSLFGTGFVILIAYLFVRKFLKRSPKSLGLVDKDKIKNYGKGLILGIGILAIVVVLLRFMGIANIAINFTNMNLLMFLLFALAWMIQGFEEEFIFRSILMNHFAKNGNIIRAILLNAVIFSLLHSVNNGFGILAFVNILLVGIIFSLVFYLTDSIYLSAAFHSFWNMAQANIFGISVSGIAQSQNSVFLTSLKGPALISGGNFGIEASLITTLVLAVILIVLIKNVIDKGYVIEK